MASFDRIKHSTILSNLIAPKSLKLGIFRCLKAGVNPEFPEQGTCQGGVVSPLLANIALNGIENVQPISAGRKVRQRNGHRKNGNQKYAYVRGVSATRYADDMVFILKDTGSEVENNRQAEQLTNAITDFLSTRGMELSPEKTKLTRSTDGFDFLGWHFKVQRNGKFRSTPSKENYTSFKKKIKNIINSSNIGSNAKARKLAPVVRGWRSYHKSCKMDGSRNSLYFTQKRAYKVFNRETKNDRHSSKELLDKAFPSVPYSENCHIKVKEDKSPYDGDLIYWSKRESKLYDGSKSQMLRKQSYKCGHCGMTFIPGEEIHLHHIDGNHNNWKTKNLMVIHRSCHQYTHMRHSES